MQGLDLWFCFLDFLLFVRFYLLDKPLQEAVRIKLLHVCFLSLKALDVQRWLVVDPTECILQLLHCGYIDLDLRPALNVLNLHNVIAVHHF